MVPTNSTSSPAATAPAWRGTRVLLCEKNDLAQGTSSRSPEQLPAWTTRAGLPLYGNPAGARACPAPAGSTCGATPRANRSATISARRRRGAVSARVLVSAAGPWVERVLSGMAGSKAGRHVRMVKGSHLVMREFWDGPQAYLLQNDDKRVIFASPYEDDLCLIGTTDIPFTGAAEDVRVDDAERDYLLRAVNCYMRRALTPADILCEFSGVRPLYDHDAGKDASAVTRHYACT